MSQVMLTENGFRTLSEEYARLRDERGRLGARMRWALEFGGASPENGEYVELRREIELLDRRIVLLEHRVFDAQVVDPLPDGEVDVGEDVTVIDLASGETHDFRIVGPGESTLGKNHVSYLSPVGAALLGRRVGDIVEVAAPSGVRRLEIVEIDG